MRVFMEATQARLSGQGPKAVQLYQQCLRVDPTNSASMFELSKLYHQGQNMPQAVDYAKRAVAADKENIWYRFLLADLYQQADQQRQVRGGRTARPACGRRPSPGTAVHRPARRAL